MQMEFFGFGSVKNLKKILENHNPKSILLVRGKKSFELCGARETIEPILKNYSYSRFSDFEENPKIEDIKKGVEIAKKNKIDFIIAVGGGSSIDVAKTINLLYANKEDFEIITNKENIAKKGSPLVAIPTTSGSGSEATKFAVVYIGKTKHSLDHDFVLPDYSIIDPSFTMNLQRAITASTAMDAFCQAIESYWSVHSNAISKDYSKKALEIIYFNIEKVCNSPDKKSRESLAKGSNLAGKAINIAKTTACHAVSYPITSYFSVPHGHAVALTLGQMLIFNSQVNEKDVIDTRGQEYVRKTISELNEMLGAKNPKQAAIKIKKIMESIGLSVSLSKLGIKYDDIDLIVQNGFNPDRVKNNPRMLTKKELYKILNNIV